MKRISLILTSLVLFCSWLGAQNAQISFNTTDHDFGVISEKGGRVTFDFILTNNSNAPVVITRVVASCGCTTPLWTKEPVEPGKTGTVTAIYDPTGRPYPFSKVITVFTNLPTPSSLIIRGDVVQGEVVQEAASSTPEYTVAIGDYFMKSKDLDFGPVSGREAKTIRLEVYNNSDKPMVQRAQRLPRHIAVSFNPATIPANSTGTIDVRLNANDNSLYGNLSGEITLAINNAQHSFPYSATVLDDFSQWTDTRKANAGKINVSASAIDFGNLDSGNSRTLRISNSGKSPLNVRNIQSSDPLITVNRANLSINPGEIAEIRVNADSRRIQSTLSSTLAIITDDPNRPIYEIAVSARH
jgi:hypothetical protein